MDEMIYLIWLSILDLRPIEKIKLLEFFKTAHNIFKLDEKKLRKITNSTKLIEILESNKKIEQTLEIFEKSQKEDIKILSYKDSYYSKRLLEIYDYPIILYAKGNLDLLNSQKTISIVGSRECTEYGMKVTQRLSYLLSKHDYTIISGLAKGIDGFAHRGCLNAEGSTIAVLGCGIDYIYPAQNKELYNNILKQDGLIISEYPLNTRPNELYFPMRNRIIAGMADKVLVTEAGENSGSIITANIALEQGKEVYAIPGNITSKQSKGTNELIKDGAILVDSLEDIF